MIKAMIAAIEKMQADDGSDADPDRRTYILEGFTDPELETIKRFIYSFDYKEFRDAKTN